MFSDLRLSLRAFSKARGFTLIAVLTLAVGIGASTTIFSAVRALVIAPMHYPGAEQLVHVWSGDRWPLSEADFLDLHAQSSSFSAFGVYRPTPVNFGQENAQSVSAVSGTAEVLRAFGVSPVLGRLFTTADDEAGAAPVVILGYSLWQQALGGRSDALGQTVRINGADYTVVGVMPADFDFLCPWMSGENPQLWLPYSIDATKARRGSHGLLGIARLKPGVTVEAADAEIKTIGRRLSELYPDTNTKKAFLVRSLQFEVTRNFKNPVWMLAGAVALLLMVACGNVAGMLLARSAGRQGELAVRVALGADRMHLIRLALLESLVLAAAGAVVGIMLAYGGVEVVRSFTPVSALRKAAISVDLFALGFAVLAAVGSALLAGLPPALAALRTSPVGAIRSEARSTAGSLQRHRMLRFLIIGQVAVAFVLANGAVLLAGGYSRLLQDNRLLATDSVASAWFALRGPRYKSDADRVQTWDRIVERVRALPGVTHVAVTSKLPLEGGSNSNMLVNDEVYDPTQSRMLVEQSAVTQDYFAAMGLQLVRGRLLGAEDRPGDVRGVVVNQEFVSRAWPDKDPIGQIIRGNSAGKPWITARVVGVVENVRQWSAEASIQPEMYTTAEGRSGNNGCIIVRSTLPLDQLAPLLRREMAAVDPELGLRQIRTMRQVLGDSTVGQRAVTALVNFFMVTALALVAVGLYGTLSYHVQQRTREIGVRIAIGALRPDILRLVFVQGGRWVAGGLVLGLVASVALRAVLKALVYRMDGVGWLPMLGAVAAVAFAGIVACWLPAWRAARLDPMQALRAD